MEQKKVSGSGLEELADQVGEFIRYWGFKKVHGKIWLHIFLSAEPLDAAALIERLGISKALASMSINDLVEYRVILPQGKSARGTQLFAANPNVMEAILHVLRTRERKMLTRVQSSYEQVKAGSREAVRKPVLEPKRVAELGELIRSADDLLSALIEFRPADLSAFARFATPLAAARE